MSQRSRQSPRRSCLAVPGSSDRMIEKAQGLDPDMVFLDLEDAVSHLEKVDARARVAAAIREGDWGDRVVSVRVNDWTSPWTLGDLTTVVPEAGPRLDTVMIPKVDDAGMLRAADLVLSQIERQAGLPENHVGLEAQIESAHGLMHVESICAASPRLETVILGPVDLSASLGMATLEAGVELPAYPGDYFHYAYMKLLVAGRANGLQVIDGPYVRIRDLEGLRNYAQRAQLLGYDGKWALHPDQIAPLNELFSPSDEEFERARSVLDAYEAAVNEQRRGAIMLGDEMIDEASRKAALRVVMRRRGRA